MTLGSAQWGSPRQSCEVGAGVGGWVLSRGTYSSVTSFGMPLGRVWSPLLLHRTTVSTQVHCSGQRGPR